MYQIYYQIWIRSNLPTFTYYFTEIKSEMHFLLSDVISQLYKRWLYVSLNMEQGQRVDNVEPGSGDTGEPYITILYVVANRM